MLNPDYRDMLSMLNDEGVEYLVVGAHALAAHGWAELNELNHQFNDAETVGVIRDVPSSPPASAS